VASVSQNFQTYRYSDVNQYIQSIYAEQSAYTGGLFILSNAFVNQFASTFSDYRIDLAITQKLYNSYATKVTTYTPIADFLQLLQTLPTTYNPNDPNVVNLYRTRIIDIFGTDITVTSTHGGIFYQQTAVKECYGGNITPDQESEMATTIAKQPPGGLAYINYRKLGVFDVKGGNPELPAGDYAAMIASFPQDPAVTSFTSIPLWEIAPANYKAALQAAINQYCAQSQVSVNALINSVAAQRVQSYKNPQSVFIYGQQTAQYGSIIHWDNCPFIKTGGNFYTPRCTIGIQTASLSAGQNSVFINENWEGEGILTYTAQRDPSTGDERMMGNFHPTFTDSKEESVNLASFTVEPMNPEVTEYVNSTIGAYQNGDNTIYTVFQRTGCVSLDYVYLTADPNDKLYFTACIDCLPIIVTSAASFGLKNSDLQCVCPGF